MNVGAALPPSKLFFGHPGQKAEAMGSLIS